MRALALLLAVLSAAPAAAQQVPPVQPGGIASLVAAVESDGDSVTYRLTPAAGVRLFAPAFGRIAAPELALLPFTFGLPPQAAAGRMAVAELALEWPDGRRETRELVVDVLARRAASFWIASQSLTAAAGGTAELPYGIENLGNAADTFRVTLMAPAAWTVKGGASTVVLRPGERATGTFEAMVPATATAGEEYLLRTTLSGTDVREARPSRLTVVLGDAGIGGLASVPGALFVGSTTGPGGLLPGVALTARGEVRAGVRLDMALRHSDERSPPPAFRGALSGPQLRVGLTAESWSVRAGDLFSVPDLIAGPVGQGRGVEASFDPGAWSTAVFLARPASYTGTTEDGHIARASARYSTPHGTFGVRAGSVERSGGLMAGYRQSGGAFTYSLRRGAHDVEAEAGMLTVSADSAAATGAAAEVRYSLTAGPLSMAARLRRVPGTTSRTASHGNETFISGSYDLTPAVALRGSAYATDARRIDGAAHGRAEGAALGLRLGLANGVNASITGAYRANELIGSAGSGGVTRLVKVGADLPVAAFVVEADTDLGVTDGPDGARPYRYARVGTRWGARGQWGWVGISHHDFGFGAAQTGMDLSGAIQLRSARLEGGLSAPLTTGTDRPGHASFWSALNVPVLGNTALSTGVEYRGFRASPWRFSLGVRRTFGLPLPLTRKPVLEGVVFQDLDADGIRDPGEPPLPGIRVTSGRLRARTDEDGRFRFFNAGGGPLRVEPSDLPLGVSLPDGVVLPDRGSADIPLVRVASLELRLFLDRDGDEIEDAAEGAAVGALVSVIDEQNTARDALTDAAGRARFNGLRPGRYTVRITRSNGRGQAETIEVDVVLRPGAGERLTVPVPLRSLEIRLPNGARLGDPADTAVVGLTPGDPDSTPGSAPSAELPPADRPRDEDRAREPAPRDRSPGPSPAGAAPEHRAGGEAATPERANPVGVSAEPVGIETGGVSQPPPPSSPAVQPDHTGDRSRAGLLVALILIMPGVAAAGIHLRLPRRT